MVDIGNASTWIGVHRQVRWRRWEKIWNADIKRLYDAGQGVFTRDEIYASTGVGRAGRTRWDHRWALFVGKHRGVVEQVMTNFKKSGAYEKYKAQRLTDEEIWLRMLERAVEEGYYPVWADPYAPRRNHSPPYKLFDLDGFVELMMRGVRAGIKRAENVGRSRYLPGKDLYPSLPSKARVALNSQDSRPYLTDGARELTRIECEICGKVYASQRRFTQHYESHSTPGTTAVT